MHFTCNFALIRYFLWHYALVWICMPVIDGLLFGNSNHPGVHKASTRANHRAGPNPAPAQDSLNRKPAPDANPRGRWVFQMQHIALTRTRPLLTRSLPAQWTFFWAQGQAEGLALQKGWALVGAGTTLATGQKLYLTKDAWDRSHLRQNGNKTKKKKKRLFAFLWKVCFIYKYIISSNLQSQITTCSTGTDTIKHLKTKYINPGVRRQWLNLECKLCTTFLTCDLNTSK